MIVADSPKGYGLAEHASSRFKSHSPGFVITNTASVGILTFALLLSPALGKTRAVKKVPPATTSPLAAASITLSAKNVASSRKQSPTPSQNVRKKRVTTVHTTTVEITAGNLGATTQEVILHCFWV
jgi:hypothetical protein